MSDKGAWIFALDLGSKCTGFAFGTEDTLVKYGKYVAKNPGNVSSAEKLLNFSKWLATTINSLPRIPTVIVIESPYLNNNVKTYGVLSQYLGVALRECFRLTNLMPEQISPSKVKNVVKPEKSSNYYRRKQNMVIKINDVFGLDLNYHKSNKRISDDDTADAIALWYTYIQLNFNETTN